jgi:enoyl-CoA hydratase/carnithine racemase
MMETRRIGAYAATHFRYAASYDGKVATITLDRPTRRNPLTFDAYAELRDLFRALALAEDVKAVVVTGSGGHFCSGGDVHEIIGPLTAMSMPQLLAFTRMTGDLVLAMRTCPQPIVAVVDGTCAGAGAMIALASDFRIGTPEAKTAFLFVRVGLAGSDMGACALLPRVVGQGRAAELLYTGRVMTAEEGRDWGFFNRLVADADALADGDALARSRRQRGHGHASRARMERIVPRALMRPTSTPSAAVTSHRSGRRGCCASACPRASAEHARASTRGRSACCARRSRNTPGSPTSRSRCRGSVPGRSRSAQAPTTPPPDARARPVRARRLRRSRCPSPTRDRTLPR